MAEADPSVRQAYRFELPEHLIAQHPLATRSASRLLLLDRDGVSHRQFDALPSLLRAGDRLVFNDSRVLPARVHGEKATGGRVELHLERLLGPDRMLARLRANRTPTPGASLRFTGASARVIARRGELFELAVEPTDGASLERWLEAVGDMPLPPYIRRAPEAGDRERYQTIYARKPGAVAAPTAGLHFDRPLLEALAAAGIHSSFVTLHVGAGTFSPMRADRLDAHEMHRERLVVDAQTVADIHATRQDGGRIVAVGTTAVRSLETAARATGTLAPYAGETDLFLRPGSPFHVVDGLVTNFHLPESTLLMLICAFAGLERTLDAYREAVRLEYRFFSYGDAMLAWRRDEQDERR